MAEWSSLLTAIGGVVSAVVWPAVVLGIALIFRAPFAALLRSDDVSLTVPGGVTLVAQRKAADATGALLEAARSRGDNQLTPEQVTAEVVDTQRQMQTISDPVILWVDDVPSDTEYERYALESLGMSFDLSASTEDALAKIRERRYDTIISDMGRPPDDRAGYTLLEELRRLGDRTPVVLYTTSRAPEHVDEAVRHGALGCTDEASELMQMVVTALKISRRARSAR